MSHQYTIISNEDGSANVLLLGHGAPLVAHSSHANYKEIVKSLSAATQASLVDPSYEDETDYVALFDQGVAVKARFQALSERVTVEGGHILLDGDVVDDSLTEQIVRFLDEGIDNWKPLVAFLENVAANPQIESKTQLYDWLRNQEGITITTSGSIVGYKGVARDGDGSLKSIHSGTATVQRPGEDPEIITGRIPNEVGSIVTMARSEVVHDPNTHCHRGLHVGTQRYASSYGQVMLEVHVNPRDVVSVPNDANGEKIRVCRYTIVKVLDSGFRYEGALREDDEMETLDDDGASAFLSDVDGQPINVGDTVVDEDGDYGTVVLSETSDTGLAVEYDDSIYGTSDLDSQDVVTDCGFAVAGSDEDDECREDAAPQGGTAAMPSRPHGRGGATSQDAKGNGRNPAQDNLGRFSAGRPGSYRDSSTGRFA